MHKENGNLKSPITPLEATTSLLDRAREEVARRGSVAIPLALKVLLVGFICHFSTEIGFALKFPPHYISPLWPTGAILFSVLVATPIRHWWAYTLAAYFTSVANDARAGFPVSAILFVIAGLLEIFVAAVGVRRFAGGLRAFDSLRSLVAYIMVAVVLAPFISAFVAAFAGSLENYWFYWRVWFLSEALAYLMLAPAVLTWIASARTSFKTISLARYIEACLMGCGLVAISIRVFSWPVAGEGSVPLLVYLPLPFLIWAAVRFGPGGVNTALLVVAFLSISGTVLGRGPFAASTPDDSVLPLQLFLVTMSVPLMLLATLINERREKEEALRESEERVTLAASAGKLGLWFWDVPRDQFWVGHGRRALFGWEESEPVDFKRFIETVHPEDRERVLAGVSWALKGGGDYVVEYRIVLSDGSMRWLVTRARVELDDGRPTRVRGVSIDITERKLIDEALRESEARFRIMANTAPVMIWMSGPDKLCIFFNKGWLDFTGRTMEQELGNGWTEGVHPDDFDHCSGIYVNAFDARREFTMEYRLRRFDGEYGWLLDHGVPRFESDGTFLGYIGTAIDITERKRAESELQRQRGELAHLTRVSTMGELSASLAHELNQPLTAILSNAQAAQRFLAANPVDVEELREIMKDIVEDDSRASDVIQRMRALVKKEDLAFATLDLAGVIGDVAALVHSDAILHGVRILLELHPGLPAVRGDKVQLQQVVLNLLLNAFDAMKDRPVNEREVKILAETAGASLLRLAVRDHGTGLSGDKLDKIFQPFYTTKPDGLGMGLAISRSIIDAHGGRLWAENNPDRGATFYCTLPVSEEGGKVVEGRVSRDGK
jgi:PAS domain S-box-containing protein